MFNRLGEEMKTHYLKILVALICLAGWGVNAQAQTRGENRIDLPFNFVIDGQNLPAGVYTVSRFSNEKRDGLILSSYENHVSVFVHPAKIESAPAGTPSASFVLVGRRHFLSRIETAYDVYTIPVPRTASLLVQQTDPHEASQSHSHTGR
jgi:hypothetical protein